MWNTPHIVILDELLGERADELGRLRGDALIAVLEDLREGRRGEDELGTREPRGEARLALPDDLVLLLLRLLHLAAAVGEALEDALLLLHPAFALLAPGACAVF